MLCVFLTLLIVINAKSIQNEGGEKIKFCEELQCNDTGNKVCGIREENEGYRLRLFNTECQLLKYGCEAETNFEYGITNMEYCEKALNIEDQKLAGHDGEVFRHDNNCSHYDCRNLDNKVCGMKNNGTGYQVRLFKSECELFKYNCETNTQFNVTDFYICNGLGEIKEHDDNIKSDNEKEDVESSNTNIKNIILVDSAFDSMKNINNSIENFFAATHVFDLPLKVVDNETNTRRMHIKTAGPVMVFKPWITIPKNISEDYYHAPTLSSCYHKCPVKCPNTYAPVCGRPGVISREPSLVFKNHCYMDYAQCKMRWENRSQTAISSSYVEASFIFCLGDELNGLYRLLPLIRTLQHMGRLKKKGWFRYKFRNMRFFNNNLLREPKIMG